MNQINFNFFLSLSSENKNELGFAGVVAIPSK
ncbi:unnamed protein product [Allacma fusca]|uniref:Uncharacterized protein n=1 Tax=Allacma fusca TaxID=39272 RepID=A0A8J2K649_9HEXA|nr:unnamed protein product [Allacma fusca]